MEFPNTYAFQSNQFESKKYRIFTKGNSQAHAYLMAQDWLKSNGIPIPEWFKNHNYQVIDISTFYGIYMLTGISEFYQYKTIPINSTFNKFNDYIISNKNNSNQTINVKASCLQKAYESINTLFSNNGIEVPEWLTEGSPNALCTEILLETISFISYCSVL